MWHTAEMVKIFEKMTEGYGYDIYQNRKLCVALCKTAGAFDGKKG